MLTACIVYVQGNAGNLLARCLSLDPATVSYGNANTAEDRFHEYNNWNSQNWSLSEEGLEIDYMTGKGNFVDHEEGNLKLIHRLHPGQFSQGEITLWNGSFKWKNLIFIEPNDLNISTKLAVQKRTDLNHGSQIEKELEIYKTLLPQATYTLPFTDIFDKSKFCKHIQSLCETIDVKYYQDYVNQIWTNWYIESLKIL